MSELSLILIRQPIHNAIHQSLPGWLSWLASITGAGKAYIPGMLVYLSRFIDVMVTAANKIATTNNNRRDVTETVWMHDISLGKARNYRPRDVLRVTGLAVVALGLENVPSKRASSRAEKVYIGRSSRT